MNKRHPNQLLPYQRRWIEDEAAVAIGEKSRRIGWTFASAFRAVDRRIHQGTDLLYTSADLSAALQDPVEFVRVWAAAALARVAPPGGESVTVLIAELGNELAFVRSLAAWHLGRLGPAFPGIEQAHLPLRQLADDKDPSVRVEAALALGMLAEGKGAPPPELKSLCT